MPLDKFVLILVCVVAAAAATIWAGGLLAAAISIPYGWLLVVPASLVVYVLVRVIAERVGNTEDDHYDQIDH